MLLVLLVVLSSAFDLSVPFFSKSLIDTLISFLKIGGPAPLYILLKLVLAILAATILTRIIKSSYDYQLFKLTTATEDKIKHETFEKYLRLHTLFHHGSSSGQMIGRIERGATAIYNIIYDILGQSFLPSLVSFLAVFFVILLKSPLIAFVILLPLPIYIISVTKLSNTIYDIEKKSNEEFEAVSKGAYDVASNVHTVKKFSQEEPETRQQIVLQAKARQTQYGAERLWEVLANVQTVITTIARIGVISIASYLVIQGKSSIGEFVLYISLQNMAYSPLSQLSFIFPRLRRNTARVERLFEILDEPINILDKPDASILKPMHQDIKFKNIWFRYSEKKSWALRNLNITVPARTTVALVGRSGSGKTTFINLLLRSFDPTKGAILIDDHDIRDVTQQSLRDQIAVVPQEVDLFSRTIAENIAYGQKRIDKEKVDRAAKTALADGFIKKLEQGYDTVVGERGIKLSGGERQRVGIARAILRDPKILILDEATSHLDTESERLIQKATDSLIKDRTAFIIAHRLSTVLHADLILVFKNGAIESSGTHSELLKSSPTYQLLHSLQFSE